jgi:predicted nuclease with TOPRIM domain
MISIPVSVGELLDKLSILHIKKLKIQTPNKLEKVAIEYKLLYEISENYLGIKEYFNLYDELIKTNSILWEVEDRLRILEKNKTFNEEFVELARKVYYTNDERFELKNKINLISNSEIQEQKNYEDYKN